MPDRSERPWQAEAPVTSPDQWPESRGFLRVYHGNPEAQARLVRALCGLHAHFVEWGRAQGETAAVAPAIRTVLGAFGKEFTDFQHPGGRVDDLDSSDYRPDERLLRVLEGILADE